MGDAAAREVDEVGDHGARGRAGAGAAANQFGQATDPYTQPAPPATRQLTIDDVVTKTAITLGVLTLAAAATYFAISSRATEAAQAARAAEEAAKEQAKADAAAQKALEKEAAREAAQRQKEAERLEREAVKEAQRRQREAEKAAERRQREVEKTIGSVGRQITREITRSIFGTLRRR
mgnify:CR=1 FL=1